MQCKRRRRNQVRWFPHDMSMSKEGLPKSIFQCEEKTPRRRKRMVSVGEFRDKLRESEHFPLTMTLVELTEEGERTYVEHRHRKAKWKL